MPLFVYRHFTGALCTTSSEGRFALFSVPSTPAFLLGSGLSNSSDMARWVPADVRETKKAPGVPGLEVTKHLEGEL
jgi:hypothetical protein